MRELTCIGCPIGCALKARVEGAEIHVEGNTCPRGEKYAVSELTNPERALSSTVALLGGEIARLPVRTRRPVPKARLMDCMAEIRGARMRAPVEIGDVVIENCAGTGIDVVATRRVRSKMQE